MPLRPLLIAAVLAVVVPGLALAAEQNSAPKSIGTFGGWQAYAVSESGQKVCYMALRTHGAAIKKAKRGAVILMITQRPAENTHDVFSYSAGYNFKASSDLKIAFGKTDFDLFTKGDTAWSRDAMTDHSIATAIRKNANLTATGTPASHGAGAVADTISLKGADEAYHAIGKACGIPVENLPKPAPVAKKKAKSRQ